MTENTIDLGKTVDKYMKFKNTSAKFCKKEKYNKGKLFYYKKIFLYEGIVFLSHNIEENKIDYIEDIVLRHKI